MTSTFFALVALLAPPTAHDSQTIHGFRVHVDTRLLTGPDTEAGRQALDLIRGQLVCIALTVPADKLAKLRRVPIWLDRAHGKLDRAQYHPSAGWLTENGYDRAMVKSVHVPRVRGFLDTRTVSAQPCVLLHELAHSYHDQVLGFADPRIEKAFTDYVSAGKHRRVLHANGSRRDALCRNECQGVFRGDDGELSRSQ